MNFKELLKTRNITEAKLAELLHFSRNTVSNWCLGKRTPSIEVIKKIATCLNVTITEVVESLLERRTHESESTND